MKGLAKRNNKTRGKTLRRRKSRGKTARRRKTRGGGDDEEKPPEWLNAENCKASLNDQHKIPDDIVKEYFQEMCRTELELDDIYGGKKRKTHKKRK